MFPHNFSAYFTDFLELYPINKKLNSWEIIQALPNSIATKELLQMYFDICVFACKTGQRQLLEYVTNEFTNKVYCNREDILLSTIAFHGHIDMMNNFLYYSSDNISDDAICQGFLESCQGNQIHIIDKFIMDFLPIIKDVYSIAVARTVHDKSNHIMLKLLDKSSKAMLLGQSCSSYIMEACVHNIVENVSTALSYMIPTTLQLERLLSDVKKNNKIGMLQFATLFSATTSDWRDGLVAVSNVDGLSHVNSNQDIANIYSRLCLMPSRLLAPNMSFELSICYARKNAKLVRQIVSSIEDITLAQIKTLHSCNMMCYHKKLYLWSLQMLLDNGAMYHQIVIGICIRGTAKMLKDIIDVALIDQSNSETLFKICIKNNNYECASTLIEYFDQNNIKPIDFSANSYEMLQNLDISYAKYYQKWINDSNNSSIKFVVYQGKQYIVSHVPIPGLPWMIWRVGEIVIHSKEIAYVPDLLRDSILASQ